MEAPDRLERRIRVAAPREHVWKALTEPSELLRWFPTRDAEVDLRVGGVMRFAWESDADECVIEAIERPERFVFRWRPEGRERPFTTVSITLRETRDGGTEVTLVESGFARLAERVRAQAYEGNAKGWAAELAELKAFLERERV